jgi:hypothetical protein
MSQPKLVYRIDASDRITYVSEGWDAFASANGGAGAHAADVVGASLWDFVSDATTREVYRQVLARIRAGRQMAYSFRCDSPACRRLLEMRIRLSDAAGGVEFTTATLHEAARELRPVSQGDGSVGADEPEVVRVCGWCNRFYAGGEWRELEDAFPRLRLLEYPEQHLLTHGMCEGCYDRMVGELSAPEGAGAG